MAHAKAGNHGAARELFIRALALNPRHVPAMAAWAEAERCAGALQVGPMPCLTCFLLCLALTWCFAASFFLWEVYNCSTVLLTATSSNGVNTERQAMCWHRQPGTCTRGRCRYATTKPTAVTPWCTRPRALMLSMSCSAWHPLHAQGMCCSRR